MWSSVNKVVENHEVWGSNPSRDALWWFLAICRSLGGRWKVSRRISWGMRKLARTLQLSKKNYKEEWLREHKQCHEFNLYDHTSKLHTFLTTKFKLTTISASKGRHKEEVYTQENGYYEMPIQVKMLQFHL